MVRKPPHSRAGCIVEPYNASRRPNSHIYNVCLVKGRQCTPRARNFYGQTLQVNGFLYKHMGILQSAVTLILRYESKFPAIKILVLTHSACPCKKYLPKCSQVLSELHLFKFLFFQASVHTKQKKNCPKYHIIHLGCTVEPYKASKQPRMHSRAI